MPKLLSINVSLPKEIDFEGQKVTTGIFRANRGTYNVKDT
jgi:hypothetical protein